MKKHYLFTLIALLVALLPSAMNAQNQAVGVTTKAYAMSLQSNPGIHEFLLANPYGSALKFALGSGEMASAGAYGAGKYYVMTLNSSNQAPVCLRAYDLKTGEGALVKDLSQSEYYFTDLAYDYESGMLYGLLNDYPNTTVVKINPSTGDLSNIFTHNNLSLYGIAADYDGQLYTGSVYGRIYKLDKQSGAVEECYSTNVSCNNLQSLDFDYNTGELYWLMQGYWGSEIYIIDLDGKTHRRLGQFPSDSYMGGLHLVYTEAVTGSAGAVTELKAEQNSSKQSVISWKNPTTTLGGAALGSLSKVEVYRNGTLVKSFSEAAIGASLSWTDETISGAESRYMVVAYSGEEAGFPAWINAFSGFDKPGAVQNVKATKQSESSILVEWEAPATGENGYPYDASSLAYKVVRMPDQKVLSENTSNTSILDEGITKYSNYSYVVTAITAAGESKTTTSNLVAAGPGEQLPFESPINTVEDFARWAVYDRDEVPGSWYLSQNDMGVYAARSDSYNSNYLPTDNWLVSPPLYMKAGINYELTFEVYTAYYSSETLFVKMGASPEPENLSTDLKELTVKSKYYEPERVSVSVSVATDGYYHFGFEHKTTGNNATVAYVCNVVLQEFGKGSLNGKVTDSGNNPLADASVLLKGKEERTTKTAADGSFSFADLPSGSYEVSVEHFGYKPKKETVEVKVGETATCNLVMDELRAYKVSGEVKGYDEKPISGARITLTGYATYKAISGTDGRFEFPAVYESSTSYKYTVDKNNYEDNYGGGSVYVAQDATIYPIYMDERNIAPASITVDNASGTPNVSWEGPVDIKEFKYDNGFASSETLGYDGGREDNIIANIFREPVNLREVRWFTLPSENKSPYVNLYVMALNDAGEPTGETLFSQMNIPTNDSKWTTFELPQPVACPNGFMLALSGDGNICLAKDNGEEVIGNRTQLYTNFRTSPDTYRYFEDTNWVGAIMLRGKGEIMETAPSVPDHNFDLWRFAEADKGYPDRWEKIAEAVTEHSFVDAAMPTLAQGVYQYAVGINYPGLSASSDKVMSAPVANNMYATLTVNVATNSVAADAEGAKVAISNADHSYEATVAGGKAAISDIWKGKYTLTITQKGFETLTADVDLGTEVAYTLSYTISQVLAPATNIDVMPTEKDSERLLMWDFFANIFEDFEGDEYTDFELNPAGNYGWQYIDNDDAATYGFANTTFATMRSKMAAVLFNGNTTTPPLGINTAYEGQRELGFFCASQAVSDDYFISPLLSFHKDFKFSFYARTYDNEYGYEHIRVGYSTTNALAESFVWLDDELKAVPTEYTEYSYDIPANAKYVAINSQSPDVFLLLVDNVFIGTDNPTSGVEPTYGSFDSYDVMLDGSNVATAITETSLLLTDLEQGSHTASVVKNYKSGSSQPISVSFDVEHGGVGNITNQLVAYTTSDRRLVVKGDYSHLRIVGIAGTTVFESGYNGEVTDISQIPNGAYILMVTTADGRTLVSKIIAD